VVQTAFTNPDRFLPFDPAVESPVRGVHWDIDSRWADFVGASSMSMPRTFRVSLGVRF
jgi:hypothetical protein